MAQLAPAVREEIHAAGLTIAAYVRDRWPDGVWRGDVCGCPDDRCISYHHDAAEECVCLAVTIARVANAKEAPRADPGGVSAQGASMASPR